MNKRGIKFNVMILEKSLIKLLAQELARLFNINSIMLMSQFSLRLALRQEGKKKLSS